MSLISIQRLVKRYGEHTAVNELALTIEKGDIFGLLGPNGAGKSTVINAIAGLLDYDEGEIRFENNTPFRLWRAHIGLVPQDLAIYSELTAFENVRFFCSLYGFSGKELNERTEKALQFVDLIDTGSKRAGQFSGGMKRRLNLACAISHSPKLIIMDEPTVGIDPQSRNHILDNVKRLRDEGATILYTSHYLEEIEICNKIAVIDHGKVAASGTKQEIKGLLGDHQALTLHLSQEIGEREAFQAALRSVEGVVRVELNEKQLHCAFEKRPGVIDEVLSIIAKSGAGIASIVNESPSLEAVFLSLTGKSLRD